jgi:hypothetical protein
MAIVTPPGYTPPPADLPQRGDRATFSNRVDAWVTWFSTVILTQLAAIVANAFNNATEAFNWATASSNSASAASTSATQAQQYAASSAASAGAVVWVSGTTYPQYKAVFSPATLRAYRRITAAGVSTTDPSLDPTNWVPELPQQLPYLHVQDRKASGTAGASLTVATQNTRELQTIIGTNTITGAGLSTNQITLPAGTYDVTGWCALNGANRDQSNIYNVTDAAVIAISNGGSLAGSGLHEFNTKFTITATKVLTLRTSYAAGTATAGEACSTGLNEVYASLRFEKVA